MIRDWLRWWWNQDSNGACLVIIDLAETMNRRDLRQMAEYLNGLADLKFDEEVAEKIDR